MFLRGKSHDKTAYCAYCSAHFWELGGWPADAGCNASANDYDRANYDGDSTADDYFHAHSPGTNSEHCAGSHESNDDAANKPDWAADAHHDQGRGRGNGEYATNADDSQRSSDARSSSAGQYGSKSARARSAHEWVCPNAGDDAAEYSDTPEFRIEPDHSNNKLAYVRPDDACARGDNDSAELRQCSTGTNTDCALYSGRRE